MAKHPLRGNRLCWLETQQSLYAPLPLRDAQSLSCRAVDLAGHRQVIDGLKPADSPFSLRPGDAVNRTVIVTELG
jgi:hypothetical protein